MKKKKIDRCSACGGKFKPEYIHETDGVFLCAGCLARGHKAMVALLRFIKGIK